MNAVEALESSLVGALRRSVSSQLLVTLSCCLLVKGDQAFVVEDQFILKDD
jgi:hypothetical protein